MSNPFKKSSHTLGYNFIDKNFIPNGKDEYHFRNIQNRSGINYRKLTAAEKKELIQNNNTANNWNDIQVCNGFNAALIKNCNFFGLVRIGKLENLYIQHNEIRQLVGLYNSTIISCDFEDNVAINNVNYLSHFIIGSEVILTNINEMSTSDYSKFGNGILKEGEVEQTRIWMEVCNENAGRSIMPFDGMLSGDAYLWSRYRDDETLMQKFKLFTENKFDNKRGYYGKIGNSTIIKNCGIIKNVWIGEYAYIKGANKLKNLTINSNSQNKTQIGEGCELVNGIIGMGCRIFYGVKAVRFILSDNSQLKYGARLINSYLGSNSTISCCEVLNSLLFHAHEQHHNNSFLCASMVMGQSNIAAGATIGSNHNSRGADGELIAARGFWAGLCVNLKHNSKFATFTLLSKSDYPNELNIPIPFSLVNNDTHANKLVVVPAYFFLHNMYALSRNEIKHRNRDNRVDKTQLLEYDFLSPDSINEIFTALGLLEKYTGESFAVFKKKKLTTEEKKKIGKKLLQEKSKVVDKLEILAPGFENSKRKVQLLKVNQAYSIFKEIVVYYGVSQLLNNIKIQKITSWEKLTAKIKSINYRTEWINVGGQLILKSEISSLRKDINSGKIKSWDEVHTFYAANGNSYPQQKFEHAFASLIEVCELSIKKFDKSTFKSLLLKSQATRIWMVENMQDSKSKDYKNPFRKMVYENEAEMINVLGDPNGNGFVQQQVQEMESYKKLVALTIKQLKV